VYKLRKNSSEAGSVGGRDEGGEGGRWAQIDTKAEMNLKEQKQE
jgi:hypothetical protein